MIFRNIRKLFIGHKAQGTFGKNQKTDCFSSVLIPQIQCSVCFILCVIVRVSVDKFSIVLQKYT